jgi:hypothetical protein
MGAVNNSTICPVCGYDLGFPAWDDDSPSDEICPCCGIQFGYTDFAGGDAHQRNELYQKWRDNWIRDGMAWDCGTSQPPPGWNAAEQLKRIT